MIYNDNKDKCNKNNYKNVNKNDNNDNKNNNSIVHNTKFKMYKIRKKEVFYINIVILSNWYTIKSQINDN